MAYRRRSTRRTTRYSSSRRRVSYARPRTRTTRRRRSSSVSRRPQTVRIVVQTVGATPAGQSSVQPLRAMF